MTESHKTNTGLMLDNDLSPMNRLKTNAYLVESPAVPGDKDRSDSTKVTLEKHVDYHDRHHKGLRNTLATMSDLTKEALKKTID